MSRADQRMRSETVRRAILDTALEIGIEEGFEAVSIRKIINKMKYSTGVVYHHFKDKQEIIDAIVASESSWLRSQIMELQSGAEDIICEMQAVFHRVMRLAFEEPEKYNLIVLRKYSRREPDGAEWILYLSGKLKAAMETGLLREMDPEMTAFSIWSSFLGFNLMVSRLTELKMEQADEMFRVQFEIILKGIQKHE